jgi:hypothetical protein
MTPEESK